MIASTCGGPWQVLGIAPTTDLRQIRRAYANRLKAIDGDRDGAVFMRLRQAFEAALAWAERDDRRSPITRETTAADRSRLREPAVIAAATADEDVAERETATALADCRRAIAAGDAEAAFRLLQAAFARGLIPLTEDCEVFAELMAVAVADRSLPAERFAEMARLGNWHVAPVAWDELRDRVLTRLDAEAWYEGLDAAAAHTIPGWIGFDKDAQRYWRRRIDERNDALLFLGRSFRWSYYVQAAEWSMKKLLAQYELYEPWVADRIDTRRLAWLRRTAAMPRWKSWLIATLAIVAATALAILVGIALIELG
jgi:hypothetical protein